MTISSTWTVLPKEADLLGRYTPYFKSFDEIKKFRGKVKTTSSTVDGEVGAKNISQLFANKYNNLYSKRRGPRLLLIGIV